MIMGIGIDIVEVDRIKKIIDKWGERFITRVYSKTETDYCKQRAIPHIHFAARFAAKESFLKSLGIGLGSGIRLSEIEVVNRGEGKPELKLYGKAAIKFKELEIMGIHLSISHTRNHAAATVVIERIP